MESNDGSSHSGPDGPDKQTMDQIRARRLMKLGGPSSSKPAENKAPEAEGSQPSAAPTTKSILPQAEVKKETAKTEPTPTTSAVESPQPNSNPFSQLGVEAMDSSGTSRLARKRSASTQNDDSLPPATPPRRRTPVQAESDDEYADRILSQIFRITVDPHRMTTTQGSHRLAFLPNLNQDLNDSQEPLRLSLANLDQAIIEACSSWPRQKPLMQYLLPCWKRALRTGSSSKTTSASKALIHEEAKRLCMSNCLFALTMPLLYGRDPDPEQDSLAPYLLRGVDHEAGVCHDFIKEAIKRFDDDEAFPALFNDAMIKISTQLSALSMADDYRPYVQALLTYSRFPILLSNLAKHPCFNMAQSAHNIERNTILGPFFRLSPLQIEAVKSFLPSTSSFDKSRIVNAQDALRMVLRTLQDELFTIVNAFVRTGADTRSRTLDWFAYIMNVNHKRRAMQVNPREVASDGFMVNVTAILDRFCEPFMDNDFSKLDKIDVRYLRRHPRIEIQDETKLNADQAAADQFYSTKEEGESNFISEIFFLTLAAHHYGLGAVQSNFKTLESEIKRVEKAIASMEAERPKIPPHQRHEYEETLKRYSSLLEKTTALKHAIEGVLLDDRLQNTSLRFMRFVAVWLLRLAAGSNYKPGFESQTIKLPITVEPNNYLAYLPEYVLQNYVDRFSFVFRRLPTIIPNAVGEEMIALCVTFLRSSEFIKNPYLRSSLVSLLFSGTWPFPLMKRGVLGDQLISTKFANDYLLHALMKFYIECESTGAHTQFYDKFNIRYEIFQIIKCVWVNDVYRQQLVRESKSNRQFFIQFVNMLLNDTTYVLDEAFTKFPKMRQLERELEDRSLSTEDRQKKEEELQKLGAQATSYMQLANETLEMMKLFTETLCEAFTMPEIVSRLASMLNYNLETLAGKKAAAELSVSNKDKYHFRPIQLISDFVDIYLNLGSSQVFVEAVAADGRSYKPEVLDRVSRILTSKFQKDVADIARWDKLKVRFIEAKEVQDQAELDLGEIPAEFEDPIMGDIMKEPVLLPSRHIVDRSTIVQHLLSDAKDPFTRQPMTMEDAVPQVELKERIEKWRQEKMEEARRKIQGGGMDTSEG